MSSIIPIAVVFYDPPKLFLIVMTPGMCAFLGLQIELFNSRKVILMEFCKSRKLKVGG